jgi:hypothetical protein
MPTKLFGERQAKRGPLLKVNLCQARPWLSECNKIETGLIREFY